MILAKEIPANATKKQKLKFIEIIKKLPDNRDNRGKKHDLSFLVITVVFALLSKRSTVSSIQRYMTNKIRWLRKVTQMPDAKPVSRAHLPRMLALLNWDDVNESILESFGPKIWETVKDEWIAVDGKAMRGTYQSDAKQSTVHAASHDTRIDVAQYRMEGAKSSEIVAVRNLIEQQLKGRNLTLDAHHCNPNTMELVDKNNGLYVIQIKENQPILYAQCQELALNDALIISENQNTDSGHGRIITRSVKLFPMSSISIHSRWNASRLNTLIVVHRETFDMVKNKTTTDNSYYLSNDDASKDSNGKTAMKFNEIIRKHWGVESNNWILDVAFNEDKIKMSNGNQSQIMAKLRGLAMNIIRWSGANNFQAKMEEFVDVPTSLVSTLKQVKFL